MIDLEEDYGQSGRKYKKTVKRPRTKRTKEPTDQLPKQNLFLPEITPRTDNQKKAFEAYRKNYNLLLYGSAGTGKTFCSMAMALKTILAGARKQEKLVIIRSAAPAKDVGFLPGSLKEKARIFELPYVSVCAELFGRGDAYDILTKQGLIEFQTTSYLRGLTLRNAIVFLDEFQNGTLEEINTVITRVGENCRLIVSGDTKQTDLNKKWEKSGGRETIEIVKDMPSFRSVQFGVEDIIRSGTVKEWIIAKEMYEMNLDSGSV